MGGGGGVRSRVSPVRGDGGGWQLQQVGCVAAQRRPASAKKDRPPLQEGPHALPACQPQASRQLEMAKTQDLRARQAGLKRPPS